MESHLPGAGDPYFTWFLIAMVFLPFLFAFAYVQFLMMLENFEPFHEKPKSVRIFLSVLLFSPTLIAITLVLYFTRYISSILGNFSPFLLDGLILLQAVIFAVGSTVVYFKTRAINKFISYLSILVLSILPATAFIVLAVLEQLRNT